MQRVENKGLCIWKNIRLAVGLLLVLVASQTLTQAQNVPASPSEQELPVNDLLKLPGTIIAEGSNTKAVGIRKVAKYRVEEVELPEARTVEVRGQKIEVSRAFRVTITGGPFPVRALPAVIWIDDVALGYAVENEDLTEITVVTFDREALVEGASLYLSYGDKEKKEDRTRVPEKLSLSGAKGGRQ